MFKILSLSLVIICGLGIVFDSVFKPNQSPIVPYFYLTFYLCFLTSIYSVYIESQKAIQQGFVLKRVDWLFLVLLSFLVLIFYPGVYTYDIIAMIEHGYDGGASVWFGVLYRYLFESFSLRTANANFFYIFQITYAVKFFVILHNQIFLDSGRSGSAGFEISIGSGNSFKMHHFKRYWFYLIIVVLLPLIVILNRDSVVGLAVGLVFLRLINFFDSNNTESISTHQGARATLPADFYFDALLAFTIRPDSIVIGIPLIALLLYKKKRSAYKSAYLISFFLITNLLSFRAMDRYSQFSFSANISAFSKSLSSSDQEYIDINECFDMKAFNDSGLDVSRAHDYLGSCEGEKLLEWKRAVIKASWTHIDLWIVNRFINYIESWGVPGLVKRFHNGIGYQVRDSAFANKFQKSFNEQKDLRILADKLDPYRDLVFKILIFSLFFAFPALLLFFIMCFLRNRHFSFTLELAVSFIIGKELAVFLLAPQQLYNYHSTSIFVLVALLPYFVNNLRSHRAPIN